MKSRRASAFVAFVLDIVVNQESIVQDLDRHGRRQGQFGVASESAGGRDAQARAKHAAAAVGVVDDKVVEVSARLAIGQVPAQPEARLSPVGVQNLGHAVCPAGCSGEQH